MASRSAQWPSLPRLGTQLAALFLFFFFFLSQLQSSQQAPDIRALEIRSNISYRYARTEIFSKIANPSNESQEVVFRAVLPETAFVSGFAITVNGTVYTSHVAQREDAQREYEEARSAGRTAAHVASSARDASAFRVALNVEARAKVAFNLTYEELLQRERGRYRMRVLLDPGQVVKRLLVEARVHEDADLTLVRVPRLRPAGNEVEVDEDSEDEPGAAVSRPSPRDALVRWQPDAEAQRHWVQAQGQANGQGHGVKGLLELQYDVDRSDHSNVVLLGSDGYFVHFFCPQYGLQSLRKHVVFVLDISGSMFGRSLQQVQEAMLSILSELREETDTFSLILFSSDVHVWSPAAKSDSYSFSRLAVPTAIVDATPENIKNAQQTIKAIVASGATHMYSALETALRLVNLGREGDGPRKEPLVICLTDGEPNGPNGDPATILRDMTEMYSEARVALYSLAFGSYADFNFLKNLSRHNLGFARRIYEAADTALQLRNFYREVASPLLSNVRFQYPEEQVDSSSLTKTVFPTYLNGSELIVAGRMHTRAMYGFSPNIQADVVSGTGSQGFEETRRAKSIFSDTTHNDDYYDYDDQHNTQVDTPLPGLQRLWAYLTVRQLLDQQHGDDVHARRDALRLALSFSFVTPLTSMVVVKPDTSEVVDVESVRPPDKPSNPSARYQSSGAPGIPGSRPPGPAMPGPPGSSGATLSMVGASQGSAFQSGSPPGPMPPGSSLPIQASPKSAPYGSTLRTGSIPGFMTSGNMDAGKGGYSSYSYWSTYPISSVPGYVSPGSSSLGLHDSSQGSTLQTYGHQRLTNPGNAGPGQATTRILSGDTLQAYFPGFMTPTNGGSNHHSSASFSYGSYGRTFQAASLPSYMPAGNTGSNPDGFRSLSFGDIFHGASPSGITTPENVGTNQEILESSQENTNQTPGHMTPGNSGSRPRSSTSSPRGPPRGPKPQRYTSSGSAGSSQVNSETLSHINTFQTPNSPRSSLPGKPVPGRGNLETLPHTNTFQAPNSPVSSSPGNTGPNQEDVETLSRTSVLQSPNSPSMPLGSADTNPGNSGTLTHSSIYQSATSTGSVAAGSLVSNQENQDTLTHRSASPVSSVPGLIHFRNTGQNQMPFGISTPQNTRPRGDIPDTHPDDTNRKELNSSSTIFRSTSQLNNFSSTHERAIPHQRAPGSSSPRKSNNPRTQSPQGNTGQSQPMSRSHIHGSTMSSNNQGFVTPGNSNSSQLVAGSYSSRTSAFQGSSNPSFTPSGSTGSMQFFSTSFSPENDFQPCNVCSGSLPFGSTSTSQGTHSTFSSKTFQGDSFSGLNSPGHTGIIPGSPVNPFLSGTTFQTSNIQNGASPGTSGHGTSSSYSSSSMFPSSNLQRFTHLGNSNSSKMMYGLFSPHTTFQTSNHSSFMSPGSAHVSHGYPGMISSGSTYQAGSVSGFMASGITHPHQMSSGSFSHTGTFQAGSFPMDIASSNAESSLTRSASSFPSDGKRSSSRRRYSTLMHPDIQRVNIADVTWMAKSGGSFNGTHMFLAQGGATYVYRVAEYETNDGNVPCQLPRNSQQRAHCRHLENCLLNVFQADIASFMPYFCPLGEFIGACCPDSIYQNSFIAQEGMVVY